MLVRHAGSGGAESYFALQSGDATTFFSVNNSGDLVTSGCLNPSGGLLLEQITPSDWINDTTNRLYNDAGTLKWNGTALAVGGGFTSFNLTDGKVAADPITDSQTVTISGVSGVETQYDATSNFFRISASGLSGVLQNQITAQTYTFDAVASGYGSNNNDPKTMYGGSVLAVSGVSGVNIDFLSETDGTNNSGIFILGYDPSVSYSFNFTNGDVASDAITNGEDVTISGVSGIRAEYDSSNNFFRLGANELSGVLYDTTIDSGHYLLGQIQENTTSGIAISGIAAYASGQVDGFTVQSATSGIISQNDKYILDQHGSGYLSELNFVQNSISIRNDEQDDSSPTYLRKGGAGSIIIGSGFDALGWTAENYVAIGTETFSDGQLEGGEVAIGYRAGYDLVGADNSVYVGYRTEGSRGVNQVMVGNECVPVSELLVPFRNHESVVSVGNFNLAGSHHYQSGVAIGNKIAQYTKNCKSNIAIGGYSDWSSSGVDNSIRIGFEAGAVSSGVTTDVSVGYQAGSGCHSSSNTVFIGRSAGRNTYNVDNSVFIGQNAGRGCYNTVRSIKISTSSTFGTRDFEWADTTDTDLLDIGGGIQVV